MTSEDSLFDNEDDKNEYNKWLNNLDPVSKDHIKRMGLTTIGFWNLHKELNAEREAKEKGDSNTDKPEPAK